MKFVKYFLPISLLLSSVHSAEDSFFKKASAFVWSFGEALTEIHVPLEEKWTKEQQHVNEEQKTSDFVYGDYATDPRIQDPMLLVFSHICAAELALEALYITSQVCTSWCRLSTDQQLIPILKNRYYGHLPMEYTDTLTEDNHKSPLKFVKMLFDLQKLEYIFLCNIYHSKGVSDIHQNLQFPTLIIKSLRFDADEKHIKGMNKNYLKYAVNKIPETTDEDTFCVDLNNTMTRLTSDGIIQLKEKIRILRNSKPSGLTITLLLDHNLLRWIPDELFPIDGLCCLNLSNNLLRTIPSTITLNSDQLTEFNLGNKGQITYNPWIGDPIKYENDEEMGYFRAEGNIFKSIPSSIFELKKLKSLMLNSVKLYFFDEEEILEKLPELKSISIRHNNLQIIPKKEFIRAYGNPGQKWLTLNPDIWQGRHFAFGGFVAQNFYFVLITSALGTGYLCKYMASS